MHPFRRLMHCAAIALPVLLTAGCAGDDVGGARGPRRPAGFGTPPGSSGAIGSIGGGSGLDVGRAPSGGFGERATPGARAAASDGADDGGPMESKAVGKGDWAPVYESGRGDGFAQQRVIYVDRSSITPQKLDGLTYYTARTRDVRGSLSRPQVQELAVLCEGSPKAPASALRGEGTDDGNGSISVREAKAPLSLDQFTSLKGLRLDPSNPSTFVVRAVCLLGQDRSGRAPAPAAGRTPAR